jgi:hypothetical protein
VSVPTVRALTAQDGVAARALVHAVYAGTRHLMRTLELIDLSLTGEDPECLGLACAADDGVLEGIVLYGSIGGAAGVVRLHALFGHGADRLAALIGGVATVDSARDARMFMCELSDAPEHALASNALASRGFTVEARIAEYFADGLALDVLVLRRSAA